MVEILKLFEVSFAIGTGCVIIYAIAHIMAKVDKIEKHLFHIISKK